MELKLPRRRDSEASPPVVTRGPAPPTDVLCTRNRGPAANVSGLLSLEQQRELALAFGYASLILPPRSWGLEASGRRSHPSGGVRGAYPRSTEQHGREPCKSAAWGQLQLAAGDHSATSRWGSPSRRIISIPVVHCDPPAAQISGNFSDELDSRNGEPGEPGRVSSIGWPRRDDAPVGNPGVNQAGTSAAFEESKLWDSGTRGTQET